jgi:hypothetical protein
MAIFRHMSTLKSIRTEEGFKYETERQKIEHHGKWLKDSIDRSIHKLLCDLDMSWKVLNKSISDEENNLVQNGKELEGMNGNIITTTWLIRMIVTVKCRISTQVLLI